VPPHSKTLINQCFYYAKYKKYENLGENPAAKRA